ncbi:UNVERIFIED_CONTAM: hypothetical protein HDU68_005585 [Siphonaria sp. JEL0065]|nr:hypothetical protein HDU68_005585 [Siphonaria sp. JEL0065]
MTIVLSSTDQEDAMTDFYLGHYLPMRGYLLENMTATDSGIGSYIDMIAGDSLGVDTAGKPLLSDPTIIDLLETKNIPWKAYFESYTPANSGPTSCATNLESATSPQGNTYSISHNPFFSFSSITSNSSRCARIGSEQDFLRDRNGNNLPTWMFYVPSLENSGATNPVVFASLWLQGFLEPLLNSALFAQTLFIVTFDNSRTGVPNIYTLLIGSGIREFNGTDYDPYTHDSLLATVEKALVPLGKAFPQITFSINDATIDPADGSNIQGIVFSEDEAGFLAGISAGAITSTNVVSVIGNYPIPPIQRYMQGFLKGVKFVNPTCKVLGEFNADQMWGNETLGRQVAAGFLSQGADVVFNSAGGLGSAAIYYAAQHGVWAIGVDSDESLTTFSNKSDPASNWVFNSALKNVDIAAYNVINDKIQGTFFNGNKRFDSTNGGIGASSCSSQNACRLIASSFTFLDTSSSSGVCSIPIKSSIASLIEMVAMRLQVNALSTELTTGFYQGFQQTSNHSWVDISSFGITPGGRLGHSMTAITNNNKFLVYGGQGASGGYSSDLYLFDVDTTQWKNVKPTGSARPPSLSNHAAGFSNTTQELVIFGGSTSVSTLNQDIWKFNYLQNSWQQIANNNGPGFRTAQAYAFVNDFLYVWGGQDASRNILGDFWRFNVVLNAWDKLPLTGSPEAAFPRGKYGAVMVGVNGTTLLLFGGNDGTQDYNDLWSFNMQSKVWTLLAPTSTNSFTPTPVTNPAATVLDPRRVLFVGGISNKIPQSAGFIYNSGLNQWMTQSSLNLPIASHGFAIAALNQSLSPNACVFELDNSYSECTPISNEIMLFTYGGAQPVTGISDSLKLMFAAAEVMPPPPMKMPIGISIIGYTISGVGICFIVAMGVTLFLNAKRPAFQFASVSFLSLYLLGAGFGFLGLIFYNIGEDTVTMCSASLWFVSLGSMLIYSGMVVKNVRIYVIFLGGAQSTSLTDKFLLILVFVLTAINVAILIAFEYLAPYEKAVYITDNQIWPVCSSPQNSLWMWILLAPVVLMILIGLFLSIQTRNVQSEFNESGLINRSIYITTLNLSILIPLNLTLKL